MVMITDGIGQVGDNNFVIITDKLVMITDKLGIITDNVVII